MSFSFFPPLAPFLFVLRQIQSNNVIVARYPVNLVVAMFVAKLAFHVARIGSDVWQQQLLLARTTVGCWLQPFKSVPLFLTLLATCVCFKIVERDNQVEKHRWLGGLERDALEP
jgi:hypothetical protein